MLTSSTRGYRAFLVGATVALAAAGAIAQATAPDTTPAGVGVTPGTAAAAQEKAVPRSDTGTVVRTGRTAAERAKQAGQTVRDSATPNRDARAVGNGATGTSVNNQGSAMSSDTTTPLPAKADRN